MEYAGIEQLAVHRSVLVDAEILSLRSEVLKELAAHRRPLASVLHDVLEADPAMRANHRERNLGSLEQPDQMRTGHVQDVGRLLRSQFVACGHDRDRLALTQGLRRLHEDLIEWF